MSSDKVQFRPETLSKIDVYRKVMENVLHRPVSFSATRPASVSVALITAQSITR